MPGLLNHRTQAQTSCRSIVLFVPFLPQLGVSDIPEQWLAFIHWAHSSVCMHVRVCACMYMHAHLHVCVQV